MYWDGFYNAQMCERLPSLPYHTNYKFISITGDIPKCLEDHNRISYLKIRYPQKISNYCPISILPVVSKIAEKWVSEQLVFLNSSQFNLHPMQFGFKANYSIKIANCLFLNKILSNG